MNGTARHGRHTGEGSRRQAGGGYHVRRDVAGPQRKVVGVDGCELMVQAGDVVDEAEVLDRVHMRHGSRVDAERREGKDAGCLPLANGRLDLRRPHEVGLVRRRGALGVRHLYVVVRAADLVLGAVAAAGGRAVSMASLTRQHGQRRGGTHHCGKFSSQRM